MATNATRDPLRQTLQCLLTLHGAEFWRAVAELADPHGLCTCGRAGTVWTIGRLHLAVCYPCEVYWEFGMFDEGGDRESIESRDRVRQSLERHQYRRIEPVVPVMIGAVGALVTSEQLDICLRNAGDADLDNVGERNMMIQKIIEAEFSER